MKKPSHGIRPQEYKVLVKPVEVQTKIGSIQLPDTVIEKDKEASVEGELVAMSPLAFSFEQGFEDKPDIGDRLVFARFSGVKIRGNDGTEYRLMNDKDVLAIREGANG